MELLKVIRQTKEFPTLWGRVDYIVREYVRMFHAALLRLFTDRVRDENARTSTGKCMIKHCDSYRRYAGLCGWHRTYINIYRGL